MKEKTGKLSIKEWAEEDRPREKMLQKGASVLSDAELIAILIGSGNNEETAALPRGDFPSIPFRPLFRHKKEAASSHPRITAPPVLPPAAAELSPLRNDFSGEPLHCGTAVYCRTGKDIPIRTIVHFAWHSTYYHHIHDMLQFPGKCLIHTCRKNPGQAADHLVDLFCRHVKAFERR